MSKSQQAPDHSRTEARKVFHQNYAVLSDERNILGGASYASNDPFESTFEICKIYITPSFIYP